MKTLADLFEHTLQDVYYAENALIKALPKASKAAGDSKLKKAFDDHLKQTEGHVQTLKKVFAACNLSVTGVKCDAMAGLLKETDSIIDEASGPALNAGLVAVAQAVEHYEISRYGSLREWAKVLGHDEAHKLLTDILDEEKAANNKLTDLAVHGINAA